MFEKNELKKYQTFLSLGSTERSECEELVDDEERKHISEAFLKITLHFLRKMNQERLADCLQSSKIFYTYFSPIFINFTLTASIHCV